jgi:signal transduction histidine kinase
MSMRTFALVRDVVPVVGVIALALSVLWQGAERRQRTEVESDLGRASHVQSAAGSGDGVPWRLPEPGELRRTERSAVAPELAISAGLGISSLVAVLSVAYQRVRRRAATLVSMREETDLRMQSLAEAEREIERLRHALEAGVAERTLALQRTVAELESMNAAVSHDLRSPLASVINFAAILGEDCGQIPVEVARGYLERITSNAKAAVSLLDDLFAFSHSGCEEMHRSSVDMRRLVDGVRVDLIGSAASGGASIAIGHLPRAYADPAMMRRVFTNLVSNGLKFVNEGEVPSIEIGGARRGDELVYFVRDRGIGFDMGSLDRLFNAFGRLHPGEFEGHGIGLATVARLVRRHGGRVWAESAEGKGATFLFSLPAATPIPRDFQLSHRAPSEKSHNGAATSPSPV